jgi:hypothetical protein
VRDRRWLFVVTGLVAALMVAPPALAAKTTKFKAKPFTFDPGVTGMVSSAWVAHQGLGDSGKSDHALVLKKEATTATVASAGSAISRVKDLALTELGFDYEVGGQCGAGASRYNVTLTDGSVFFFGCSWGDVTAAMVDSQGDTWNRIRFTNADAVYGGVGPTAVWPGFGVAEVQAIHIVFDEGTDVGPGFVRLDNIDVNGKLMGKPGNSKN